MSLRTDAPAIAKEYANQKSLLERNRELLDIQEGNLLCYVEREMQKQLSAAAFEVCKHRIPPINVQKRVIDKLSQIYAKPPTRKLGDSATEADKTMWAEYLKQFKIDVSGQTLNEYFNLHKSCAWEPYMDNRGRPKLRELPKDRFFVMGEDPTDPMRVTHFIKVQGIATVTTGSGKAAITEERVILYCYTDNEFLVIDDKGEARDELMSKLGVDGSNRFGVIPFIYANRSKTHINAPQDDDMYRMVTLIPQLYADVNYAVMFQAFSIWYGINVDAETIPINPNSFVNIKATQDNPGVEPKIGVIKPELDSDKALAAILEQLALWLQSRNIRPGTVGKASADQSLTGVSKMIDEMDTTGDRQRQIPYFVDAEEDLFYLIAYAMHPIWSSDAKFRLPRSQFSKDLGYDVKFPEQISWQTRREVLEEVKLEMSMGLMSEETAMQKVNPEFTPEQCEEELQKVDGERSKKAELEAKKNPMPFGGAQ